EENRDPNYIPFYKDDAGNEYDEYERRAQIWQEEEDRYNEQLSETAALMALSELRAMGYIDEQSPTNFYDSWDEAKRQAQVDEAIAQLANRAQLNLVRGAYLQCDYGSHLRMLNLPLDHGVTVKGLPQVHVLDATPGHYSDGFENGYNIGWFGHCNAPTPPDPGNKIRLCPFTQVDMYGNHMQPQEESTKEAPVCIPEFTSHCWNNAGENQMNIKIGHQFVATLQSYIMCKHGGIVIPVTSGQEEVYMYTPDYADCPFKEDRTKNSDFMQWCEENNKCPYDPGTSDFNEWYNDRMLALKDDGKLDWEKTKDLIAERDRVLGPEGYYDNSIEEIKKKIEEINSNNYDGLSERAKETRMYEDISTIARYESEISDLLSLKKIEEEEYERKINMCNKEADALYQKWLAGMVQSGAANDVSTKGSINNGIIANNVFTTYYVDSPNSYSFYDDVNAEKAAYGSNGQTQTQR
ncbi:MAG: DUF4280 domain-containing protein, partial [Oscillospiraceae bacterium]|nr:DUF4280 domain-containing protein [Oscillospiraceae bacterium]